MPTCRSWVQAAQTPWTHCSPQKNTCATRPGRPVQGISAPNNNIQDHHASGILLRVPRGRSEAHAAQAPKEGCSTEPHCRATPDGWTWSHRREPDLTNSHNNSFHGMNMPPDQTGPNEQNILSFHPDDEPKNLERSARSLTLMTGETTH